MVFIACSVYTDRIVGLTLTQRIIREFHVGSEKLEDLAKQIADAVPPGVRNMAEGAEGKIKQVLQSQLSKLDLVTREEFDIQSQVLIRTREKLDLMEARIALLENQQSEDKE